MADVERYSFEDENGAEDGFTTFDLAEAKEYASKHRRRVIANTYEWVDSEIAFDFTDSPDDDQEEGDDR